MHSPNLEGNRPKTRLPRLRVAIEGCYPSFAETDLVMRILGVLCCFEIVDRWQAHDLFIRGPFSDGNIRRRLFNRSLRLKDFLLRPSSAVSLHVSSENTFNPNYQGFERSGCAFGVGHELRVADDSYFRIPHWWNYVDFAEDGVPSPGEWPRLGPPIKQDVLLSPLQWNSLGSSKAAFICSYLDAQRAFLFREVSKTLAVDGFGRPFVSSSNNAESFGVTKREILKSYKYSLCPENSIAPGYVTEKIPEAFACGTVPIGYVDPQAAMDFNEGSFVNLYHLLRSGLAEGLSEEVILDSQSRSPLLSTPLISERIKIESAIDFLRNVVKIASER